MAIIGKKFAILESGKVKLSGFPALRGVGGHPSGVPAPGRIRGEVLTPVGLDVCHG